jgi:hypothetical protein
LKSRPKPIKPKAKRKATSKRRDGDLTPSPAYSKERLAGLKPAWQAGQSGNPAGRPLGARSRLSEAFVAAVAAEFDRRGTDCLRQLDARDFVYVALALVPKNAKLDLEIAQVPLWQRPEDMNAAQWRYFYGVPLKTDVKPEDLK